MNIMVENKYTKPAKGSYAYLCVYNGGKISINKMLL